MITERTWAIRSGKTVNTKINVSVFFLQIEEEANRLSALANGKRIKIEEAVYPGHAGFPAMWFIPHDNEKLATGYVASPADMASTFTRAVV